MPGSILISAVTWVMTFRVFSFLGTFLDGLTYIGRFILEPFLIGRIVLTTCVSVFTELFNPLFVLMATIWHGLTSMCLFFKNGFLFMIYLPKVSFLAILSWVTWFFSGFVSLFRYFGSAL